MKTLKILFRALATYIASRCYKKLISNEEVTGEFSIKTLQNPDIDSIVYINSVYGLRDVQEPTRKTLLTKDSREIELEFFIFSASPGLKLVSSGVSVKSSRIISAIGWKYFSF